MAAKAYIPVSGTGTRLNQQARQYIDALKSVIVLGSQLKEAMAQAAADGTTDFTANMGFTSDQQGQDNAAAVQSVLASAATDIAASSAVAQAVSRFL